MTKVYVIGGPEIYSVLVHEGKKAAEPGDWTMVTHPIHLWGEGWSEDQEVIVWFEPCWRRLFSVNAQARIVKYLQLAQKNKSTSLHVIGAVPSDLHER